MSVSPSGKRRSPTLWTPFSQSRSNGSPEDAKIWNASVDHHHYLGYKHPFGCQMKYFIMDGRRRILGCLLFEGMTRTLQCRDRLIGWSAAQKNRTRHLVVVNSRFVIFAGVRVPNLASAALGLATRQLPDDWHQKYSYRPDRDLRRHHTLCRQFLQSGGMAMHRPDPASGREVAEGCLLEAAGGRLQADLAEGGSGPAQGAP